MGAAELLPWLQEANSPYKSWHCMAAPQQSATISPHQAMVRVCTNDALHNAAKGTPSPVGAAAVKEIYDGDAATEITGYAVEIKTAADTAPVDGGPNGDGSNWYWFEEVLPSTNYADSKGAAFCVPCHTAAASDTTTHAGHGDFTYLDP